MKRFFWYSVQGKILTILILFMTLSLIASGFTIRYVSQEIIIGDKEEKLTSFAKLLDIDLGDRSYDDILIEHDAMDASREEKIAVLNAALSQITDAVAEANPGMGIGYYSLELDSILTYGPSLEFQDTIGKSIDADHPGRIVMSENKELIRVGGMVRGDIMNAMIPLSRDGKVIGYIWANELTTDIEKQFDSISIRIMTIMGIFYVLAIGIAIALSRRTMKDINKIVKGLREMHSDLNKSLEPTSGELGEVVDSINEMAAGILKANAEHDALVVAEATNVAQKEFLARMSHEIRTPMNGVLGMTTLAKNAATETKRLEYLDKIQSSAALLLGIINDILDFSKIEAGKMEIESRKFNIKDTIANISELIRPKIEEKGLNLIIEIDKSVPESAIGDGLRLSQIVLNLLGNAVKFTAKGKITLSVEASPAADGKLRLDCAVKDTGIGMDSERQAEIFKPFEQADNSTARKFGGTGLGLSISKAFVNLMGGEITLKSEPDVGSEFSFFVMMDPADGDAEEETVPDDIRDRRYDGFTALLVEDNEINREIAEAILTDMGLSIEFATNGEEGVAAFEKKDYDLIFMDIRMPIMDGLEATRRIREIERERALSGNDANHPARVPIVAMTANVMLEDRKTSREAGMDGHISKPIDLDEIRSTLYKMLIG